uniref:Small ribosomal subunit protein bS18c n=1 Tax=Gracilariopsis longissima TaxID=172976 RepID=A0A345U9K0_9FLOR|nr:ribosomal protein S18 [Gracilariopsis longissima]YP_010199398.1 ribosomal protein S18 [Gracilariopsis tenuifrons]AXI97136.1 ribosomal protein S18 [Gracilariopsis longissima]UAD89052.1 ribosomal protein S18 [Gracilariopsis longissima]UAD89256.1 ribosomal protein S18 [Gracilariopsis tenuifrons]
MILYKNKNLPIKLNDKIDYKDIDLLRKFITDQGKIISRRSNGLTAKQQKQLTKSIKRARILALLPFINKD